MKRSLVVFGMIFLLMVSIVSARILNYYGEITRTIYVSAPTFYASIEEEIITEGENQPSIFPIFSIVPIGGFPQSYTITKSKLNINNPPSIHYNPTLIYNPLPPMYPIYPIKNHIKFASEPLDIDNFYAAKYTFYIKAKTNRDSILKSNFYISLPVQTSCTSFPILSSIYPFCFSWSEETGICSVNINVQQSDEYHIYEVSCNSNKLEFEEGSTFVWEVTPVPSSFWSYFGFSTDISVDGTTRIEVDSI